jgi:hypothetical protein
LNLYAETSEKGLECKRLGAARQQKYPIGTEVTEFDNFKMQNIAGKEIYTTTIVYTAYPIERPDIRPAKTRPIASSMLCSIKHKITSHELCLLAREGTGWLSKRTGARILLPRSDCGS